MITNDYIKMVMQKDNEILNYKKISKAKQDIIDRQNEELLNLRDQLREYFIHGTGECKRCDRLSIENKIFSKKHKILMNAVNRIDNILSDNLSMNKPDRVAITKNAISKLMEIDRRRK